MNCACGKTFYHSVRLGAHQAKCRKQAQYDARQEAAGDRLRCGFCGSVFGDERFEELHYRKHEHHRPAPEKTKVKPRGNIRKLRSGGNG